MLCCAHGDPTGPQPSVTLVSWGGCASSMSLALPAAELPFSAAHPSTRPCVLLTAELTHFRCGKQFVAWMETFSSFLLKRRLPAPAALGQRWSQVTSMPQMGKLRLSELLIFCGGVCNRSIDWTCASSPLPSLCPMLASPTSLARTPFLPCTAFLLVLQSFMIAQPQQT